MAPSQPYDSPTSQLEPQIAVAITIDCDRVAVVAATIDFHHHPVPGPVKVNLESLYISVHDRELQVRHPDEVKQEALELRAGFQTVKYCFNE